MDKQNNDWHEDFQLREDIELWLMTTKIIYQKILNKKINFQEFESLKIELRELIFDYIKERENKNAK